MVLGYIGFNNNMTCQDFQYEVGQTYEYIYDEGVGLCDFSFLFCRKMADVMNYYGNRNCRYAVVEALGKVIDGEDKSVTNKIRIVRELTREKVFAEIAAREGINYEGNPFTMDEIIQARENGTLGKLLPSGTEFPVQFANGERNVLVVCRDRGHTYLVTKYLMAEPFVMNDDWTNKDGWPACRMREHANEIYNMLPEDIRRTVIPMHIKQLAQGTAVECDDIAFLLSTVNVFGEDAWNPEADCDDTQIDIFRESAARIKKRLGASRTSSWWLRSIRNTNDNHFHLVFSDGSIGNNLASTEGGVIVGFCIESRS